MQKMNSELGKGDKAKVLLDIGGAFIIEPINNEKKYAIRITPSKACNGIYFELLSPNESGEVVFRAGYDVDSLHLLIRKLAELDGQEL